MLKVLKIFYHFYKGSTDLSRQQKLAVFEVKRFKLDPVENMFNYLQVAVNFFTRIRLKKIGRNLEIKVSDYQKELFIAEVRFYMVPLRSFLY